MRRERCCDEEFAVHDNQVVHGSWVVRGPYFSYGMRVGILLDGADDGSCTDGPKIGTTDSRPSETSGAVGDRACGALGEVQSGKLQAAGVDK
jgi:hypothetical protein